ncbi:MAG: segregation/condensation protein A [Deltaproteobacteria bacterium]|nr:segregation/condensation protein A [Candidatus Anaeroferrophillus wilburensis]MBN2888300.1 segregation/condensation protein A [Deltaproteobacteria bacterium]
MTTLSSDSTDTTHLPFFPPAHQRALYALEEQFYVLLDSFEGPLDLLLFLVRKNRVAIEDLPIVIITRQYLAYLELMGELNLTVASEYLVMAATLIQIKSRVLLQQQIVDEDDGAEEGEDPRGEIIARLKSYELYKKGAEYLAGQPLSGWDTFSPPAESAVQEAIGEGGEGGTVAEERYAVSLSDLLAAFLQLCERQKERQEKLEITQELVDLDDIFQQVSQVLGEQSSIPFAQLVELLHADRPFLVSLFFALLEMSRQKRVVLAQESPLQPLTIHAGT